MNSNMGFLVSEGILNHLWTIFIKVGIMEQDGIKFGRGRGVYEGAER